MALTEWLSSHILIILLVLGTLFTFFWLLWFRDRLHLKWYTALLVSIVAVLYGVFSVKTFAVLEAWGDLKAASGMSLFGGVFFMPVAYYIGAKLTKRNIAQVFDILTICQIFMLMCIRVNCLLTGCCFGINFFGIPGLRWPTREMEMIFHLILLLILGRKVIKDDGHGEIYPIYMMSYGIFRFFIEWFRYSNTGMWVHVGHIWALISFGIGLSIYAEMRRKKQKVKRVRK